MPYTIANPPDWLKNLPAGAISIGVRTFNAVLRDTGDENQARMAAWAQIKNKYKKIGDEWVRKLEEDMKLNFVIGLPKPIVMDEGTDPITSMIQIMKTVKETHPQYGEVEITEKDLKGFKQSFDDNVREVDIAIDAEHKPDGGASGWIKELQVVKDKLFALVAWTSKGVQEVKDGIYRYISPEFDFDYEAQDGSKFKNVLYAATLTNRPFLKGMAPVNLSEFSIKEFIEGGGEIGKFTKKEGGVVNVKLEEIIKMLKLEEDAKEEDVTKRLEELINANDPEAAKALKDAQDVAVKKLTDAAAVKDAEHAKAIKKLEDEKEDKPGVKLTEDEVVTLKEEASAGKVALKEIRERNKKELIDSAIADNKIDPAQTDWLKEYFEKDPDGAQKYVETAPKRGLKLKAKGSDGEGHEEEDTEVKEAQKKLDEAIDKKMAAKEGMTYREGLVEVGKENPELVKKAQDNG